MIRAFGIFNTNIPEDHKMMYGMPFPGDYLLAPDGIVRDKRFLPNYEYRPSATALALRNAGGAAAENSVEIDAGAFSATVTLSADKCFPGQELATALRIRVKPGWHIYGKPLPGNYRATELIFESPIVGEQSIELPAAKPMPLEALGETLPVYSGSFEGIGSLLLKFPMDAGQVLLSGQIRFQQCSETVCEAPQTLPFQLPLTIEPFMVPTPKK